MVQATRTPGTVRLQHFWDIFGHFLMEGGRLLPSLTRPMVVPTARWRARATDYMSIRKCLGAVPLMLTGNSAAHHNSLAGWAMSLYNSGIPHGFRT